MKLTATVSLICLSAFGAFAQTASPSVLAFNYQTGSNVLPQPQTVQVSGGKSFNIEWQSCISWSLIITPDIGTTPARVSVSFDAARFFTSRGMADTPAGTYTCTFSLLIYPVNSVTGALTHASVTVLLTITEPATAPPPSEATPVSFTYQSGGAAPPAQQWNLSTQYAPAALTVSTSGQQWLLASLSNPTTPSVLSISVNPVGMAAGNYTGAVFARSSVTILEFDVALTVLPAATLAVSPNHLSITAQEGGNEYSPASQTVSVTSSKGPTQFVFDISSCFFQMPMLGFQPSGATVSSGGYTVTPATLTISMSSFPYGVPQSGTYNCSIPITDATNPNNSTKLTIVLTVTPKPPNPPIPPLTALPSSLTFTAVQGSSATLPLLLQAGPSSLGIAVFLDTTSPLPSWLSLNNFNGSAQLPATLSVVANSSGIGPGNYSGSIKFYALMPPPQATSYVTVNVTLTVQTIPVVTATSTQLNFEYQIGGAIPSAQTIQVTASANGAAFSTSTTTTSGGNWLSLNVTSGTAPATLNVSVIPTSLLPGSYQGTVTINGVNGAAGSTVVPVKLTVGAALPTITSVVNAASFLRGNVAPGELVSVFGTAMGPSTQLQTQLDSTGKVATTLGGVQVLFNGTPAPLTYVSAGQINCAVPYEVYILGSPYSIWVKYLGQTSNALTVSPATVAPGIFATNGTGQGAILNQNGSANGPKNPEVAGNIISVFMTGEGQTSPLGITGSITCKNGCATLQQIPAPLLAPNALVNNQPATVVFYGEAPSMMAGLLQVNLVIPPNTQAGPATLVISLGGISSQTGVTFVVASTVN